MLTITHQSPGPDLFQCCRKGDLERAKYLMEEKEVNPNVRDRWDSTPLYYACLCGHFDLVLYLLESGARCDASTFDGERCIYGALTDEIRKTLRKYSVITSRVKRREEYQEFLRRLLDDGTESDVTFHVHNATTIRAHKGILGARSPYFGQQFLGRWRHRGTISLRNSLVDGEAFRLIVEWLYTAQVKIEAKLVEDVKRLCKQCKLDRLENDLEAAVLKAENFVHSKRGLNINHVQVESSESEAVLQSDLRALANAGLPDKLKPPEASLRDHQEARPPILEPYFDIVFTAQGLEFHGHKALFSARSDYFRALIHDHFHEASYDSVHDQLSIPIHNIPAEVFAAIMSHIYSNEQELTTKNVYEVLEAADLYLLPSLKRQCGNFLSQFLDLDNVVSLLQTARLFGLPRLEHQCTEFIAMNIEGMVQNEDFRALVLHDASLIQERQETDSIDIVDEIRYFLKTDLNSIAAIEDASKKLDLINDMLQEIGFDV
ncbi:ankyrin repeat and BTB/POZ domain-containing protein 1-like isoform X2 [Tigriopus californicus]|uniref:ankyrin repeat and BTB/POZ domain-containing protein 1-like isoform X2 n=1 Tax=Tigriopus californicus TaxID=6832 RepID=UPI0027D9FD86|nr:ankyrin repeat and BTB/POZ domain-containing protein 1-like isoform X2 [Tigriopus californicus]